MGKTKTDHNSVPTKAWLNLDQTKWLRHYVKYINTSDVFYASLIDYITL